MLRTEQPRSDKVSPQDVIDYVKGDPILRVRLLKILTMKDQRRKELIGILLYHLAAQKVSDELTEMIKSLRDADFESKVLYLYTTTKRS